MDGASLDPRSPPSQVLTKCSREEAQVLKFAEVMVLLTDVMQKVEQASEHADVGIVCSFRDTIIR